MSPFKVPSPDGFQAIFYQANWNTIWPSIVSLIQGVLDGGDSSSVNNTLLVFIQKANYLGTLHNFHPISLCNVSYKLIKKVIANRLQEFMENLVSPNQGSFVPRRHIEDNIIVAQELVYTISRLKGGKKFMSIKVDLEKTAL